MTETQRRRRGHQFAPVKAVAAKIPALYATESTPVADKIVYVHYFASFGDWYITELDTANNEAFGYTHLASFPDSGEWGYIDLNELEEFTAQHGLIIVERDMHWTPRKFSEIRGL